MLYQKFNDDPVLFYRRLICCLWPIYSVAIKRGLIKEFGIKNYMFYFIPYLKKNIIFFKITMKRFSQNNVINWHY